MSAIVVPASLLYRSLPPSSSLPTGVDSLDGNLPGLPRGAITEISGLPSSGKTSLLISILAQATCGGEICALVDIYNRFDPFSASQAGVLLSNLLWIRCRGDAGGALKAADLLLHGGGMGVVCLDICEVPARLLNALPTSYWYRFRRAVENTPAILLVLSQQQNVRSCAARAMECRHVGISWTGTGHARLLEGLRAEVALRKPAPAVAEFSAGTF